MFTFNWKEDRTEIFRKIQKGLYLYYIPKIGAPSFFTMAPKHFIECIFTWIATLKNLSPKYEVSLEETAIMQNLCILFWA